MSSQIEQEIQRARDWNQVLQTAWRDPRDIPLFVDHLDFRSGIHDPLLLGVLESNLDIQTRVAIAERMGLELFTSQREPLNELRVGNFLETATRIVQDKESPDELKTAFWNTLSPAILERIEFECNSTRWNVKSSEAALHAYCTFLTIDLLHGEEESKEIHREIVSRMIEGRVMDEISERIGTSVSKEGRGSVIYLGSRGAEVSQIVSQVSFQNTLRGMNAKGTIAPYYRDNLLTMCTPSRDPEGNFMTPEESVAELARVEGALRGAGLELPVKGKINTSGRISIFPGVANIGGHLLAASGYAHGRRIQSIQNREIVFDTPTRANAYRDNIVLDNVGEVMLISMGDGAFIKNAVALEMQATMNAPVINLIQDNGVAIGVDKSEVTANQSLWQRGKGIGIPGIEISETDADGLYMAMRFATLRALRDAGSTIIQSKTVRLLPHSSQHGDHLTTAYGLEARLLLERQLQRLTDQNEKQILIQNFVTEKLFRASQSDNQILMKKRLLEFVSSVLLDPDVHEGFNMLLAKMIDPYSECMNRWRNEYFSIEEEMAWEKNSIDSMKEIEERISQRKRPDPQKALEHFRKPHPRIPDVWIGEPSSEVVTMNGAQAMRRALTEAMTQNSNVLYWGTDVFKGTEFARSEDGSGSVIEISAGGYFTQSRGLHDTFGRFPYRIMNTAIDEDAVIEWLLGMSTTTVENANNQLRPFYDGQYADYVIEAFKAWHILSQIYYTTSGQIMRPMGTLMLEGATPGGGIMHSHVVEGKIYQTPASVDILCASTPEMLYKTLKYCLLYETNPYVIVADRLMLLGKKQQFTIDTGLFEPGHGRILRSGGERAQCITFGPQTNVVDEVLQSNDFKEYDIGHIDLCSLRPFPHQDLKDFLSTGRGPIIISSQEPKMQSFANQIATLLLEEGADEYRAIVKDRPIYVFCAVEDAPAVPCDGMSMSVIIPTSSMMKESLLRILEKEKPQAE